MVVSSRARERGQWRVFVVNLLNWLCTRLELRLDLPVVPSGGVMNSSFMSLDTRRRRRCVGRWALRGIESLRTGRMDDQV